MTRSTRRWVTGLGALTLLVGGPAACGGDDDGAAGTTTSAEETTTTTAGSTTTTAADGAVTLSDPATPIVVAPGQGFTITVASNPTTGYEWGVTAAPDEAVATYVGSDYTPDPSSVGVEGGGGVQTLTFSAVAEGDTQVGLRYSQPWDPQPDDETLVFAVQVRADAAAIATTEEPPLPADLQVFTDPATPIEVAAAAEFGIELESNASTGYQWILAAPLTGGVTYLGSSYRAGEAVPGAPGKQVLLFRAGPAGSSTIELRSSRVWEPAPDDQTATFSLNAA